jgi:alpha-L-fucosidase
MRDEEEDDAYKSPTKLIHLLCDVVSKNGNLLLNIGPRGDGTIPEGMQTRLLAMGKWLDANGEGIYGTRPWIKWGEETGQMNLRFTTKGNHLYVIALSRPADQIEFRWPDELPAPEIKSVRLLGSGKKVKCKLLKESIRLNPPADMGGEHAWIFDINMAPPR